MSVYRLLLRLLPRHRREQYGDEMTAVFAEVRAQRNRRWSAPRLWMAEFVGLLKFAARERSALMTAPSSRWSPVTELQWAWRAVRARGLRALFVVALLAIALASNAAMFSVADSLVFEREPFPDANRIVSLRGSATAPERIDLDTSAALLDAWRAAPDLFSAVGGHLRKTVFLSGAEPMEMIRTADITLGFLDVLGVSPRWGRTFREGDDRDPGQFAVIISADLARRRFGHPARAPGQILDATAGRLVVVGVMDASFAFPDASFHMWRALDPRGPLTQNFGGVPLIARVAPAVPLDRLSELLSTRARTVGAAAGLTTYRAEAAPFVMPTGVAQRTMFYVLLGAAFSLLLAACANVASLELAGAFHRARTYAIQLALGAPRWALARAAALEGLLLVGAGLVCGAGLAWVFIRVVATNLPDALRLRTSNPIDLDGRALLFMAAVAAIAWALGTLPPMIAASRSNLVALTRSVERTAAASRNAVRLRRALTVTEVALAVALVIGGLLYSRSYQQLLAVEKGFDSRGLIQVSYTLPVQIYGTGPERRALSERTITHFQTIPGVIAATLSSPPPNTGDSPSEVGLEIDGGSPAPSVYLGANRVDAAYFSVVSLPLRSGRYLQPDDPETNVVVPESFARRFFPNGEAVGHSFRRQPGNPWLTIVGVVGDFRTARTRMPQPSDEEMHYYVLSRPPAPRAATPGAPPPPPRVDTGGSYGFLSMTLRTDGTVGAARLLAEARRLEPRLRVTAMDVDEMYARQGANTQLAGRIVGVFSALAFIVAMAGIYSVMSFLVAGRTREIGIRMALGADQQSVQRAVIGSSARMVVIGAVVGAGLALLASRWMASEFFGVSATDPSTYTLVSVAVVAISLVATWWPARQASRVDPAVTLRAE